MNCNNNNGCNRIRGQRRESDLVFDCIFALALGLVTGAGDKVWDGLRAFLRVGMISPVVSLSLFL